MSADPSRKDGLDPVITWNFGRVGYKVPEKKKQARPLVVQVRIGKTYNRRKYVNYYGPRKGEPDAMKYRKMIAADNVRNKIMVKEMVLARASGRCALIFTQFREHGKELERMFQRMYASKRSKQRAKYPDTSSSILMGGIKNKDLDAAMEADFIFTTYSYARDALNLPHIDTVFFCTPCGDPLQAIGRLRDTGPDKKSLLGIDFYERNDYSEDRARVRRIAFKDLGLRVQHAKRLVK